MEVTLTSEQAAILEEFKSLPGVDTVSTFAMKHHMWGGSYWEPLMALSIDEFAYACYGGYTTLDVFKEGTWCRSNRVMGSYTGL